MSNRMTRKDFKRIAQVLRVNKPTDMGYDGVRLWSDIIDDMCVELKAINPNFDEAKFREACNK